MLILGFPVGALQANCYVLAPQAGSECVIIDPGQAAQEELTERLAEHELTPAGIVLTHGHFDHVASAGDLSVHYGIPVWIHPADRFMLTDPGAALSSELRSMLDQLLGSKSLTEPPDQRDLADDLKLELAGLALQIAHAPGHTGGSCLIHAASPDGQRLVFTGDVLFAGSIGRTDLPGGDHAQMQATLRDKLLSLEDATTVLAGHGPSTTIGEQRATNPFLGG